MKGSRRRWRRLLIDSGIANNGVAVVESHVVPVSNGEMGNHMGMREREGGKEREKKRKREREREREKERKMKKKQEGGRSKMVVTGIMGPPTMI